MPLRQTLLADLNIPHGFDVPLGPHTWYGVGGKARLLAHPSSIAQMTALAARCFEEQVRVYVLGKGANLLVQDKGVDGVVVQLDDPSFTNLTISNNCLTTGAGTDLFKLVLASARSGLAGLEVVAGIPGSVGGAVRMNAGGAYGEIGAAVKRVQVMSAEGHIYYRDRDDLVFGYRQSNIVAPLIVEVEFELTEEDPDILMRRVKEIFLYKRNSQPMGDHSAGCAFKNPSPLIRPKDLSTETQEFSAGSLIDLAGLKGFRIGGARVSPKHANFIVTEHNTKASDVLALMDHIYDTVYERFEIRLEREIVVWP